MSNTNVMDSNNNILYDSFRKYAFELSKITIIIMNLDVFLQKNPYVCTVIMSNSTTLDFVNIIDR